MSYIPLKERFFELIDGQLFVFGRALHAAGLSTNYYWKEKSNKKNKRLVFGNHPENNNFSLVAYESMSDEHKEKIKERFSNPYDLVARMPITQMIEHDSKAEEFFINYRYTVDDMQKALPAKRVKQYIRAIEWMNLIQKVDDSKNKLIKSLNIKVPVFFQHIDVMMSIERKHGHDKEYMGGDQLPGDFGSSQKRLYTKLEEYKKSSYQFVIEKAYGNQNAAKITDEIAEAKLLSLLNDTQQQDDVYVAMVYNIWAAANNYKTITPATVGVRKRANSFTLTMGREGNSAFNEKHIRQVKGMRPSAPLYFVEHDDNNLDFLFSDANGYNFHRYVSVVVSDSYCDLVLGKSVIQGSSPIQEQVYHAYLDAMYYIRSLTGGWHLPFEIKSDKGAGSSLIPFYQKMGKYVPAAHGNKHRGYIEQFFGSNHWKRSQKLVSEGNWNGNNMGAKYRGVNEDALRLNAKNRPQIGDEAEQQIENFFHCLRKMPAFTRENMNAPTKEQQWLAAWEQLPIEKKRPINDEQFLLTFGIKHQPQGRAITLTNRGIEPQICKVQYSYDLPEQWMYNDLIGEEVTVLYDPFDMSRVLITNDKDIRFIARTAQLSPRALEDAYTGSRTYLNAVLSDKRDQVKRVNKTTERIKELAPSSYDAMALLQGGVLIKNTKNKAEQRAIETSETFTKQYESYLDENNNLNEFFQ